MEENIVWKNRRSAFILTEALLSLFLVTGLSIFEYQQIANFKQQETNLKAQYEEATKFRVISAKKWRDYISGR